MALNIIVASDTSLLIEDLARSLSDRRGHPPSMIRPILVPSVPLRERIHIALARRLGVAMGFRFILPAALIDEVSRELGEKPLAPEWKPRGLFWRILAYLSTEGRKTPRLAPLCADDRESARAVLARSLADRFDQYAYFRPEMIETWNEGKFVDRLAHAREDEEWQRAIWTWLVADAAGKTSEAHSPDEPVTHFRNLVRALRERRTPLFAPGLEVLATGPLPHSLLTLLHAMGERGEVRLRMLLPSVEFLEDLKSGKALEKEALDRIRRQREESEAAERNRTGGVTLPKTWDREDGHPLLASLGRQAIDSFKLLLSMSEETQNLHVLDGGIETAEPPTLLRALSADIRMARPPSLLEGWDADRDRSLRVHRCHGTRREIEVLRQELLQAACDLPDLRPEEILVLAPDLEMVGPLAQAILPGASLGRLPVRLAETSRPAEDAVLDGVQSLLSFASGRGELSEGLALLSLPGAVNRLGEEAASSLALALRRSGITFGFDAAHRASLGAGSFETGTWRSGLDRLLAGFWFGDEEGALDAQSRPLLPLAETLGETAEAKAAAFDWLARLLDGVESLQEETTPARWADRLESLAEDLFRAGDSEDGGGLDEALRALRTVPASAAERPVGIRVIRSVLEEMAENEERQVRPVGGHLAIGGLKPLRALPCRVLAITGLTDAAFPRRSTAPSWDLLAADPRIGDRDPRKEDRQLFLDALLSATDRLVLTVPAYDLKTMTKEPFSVVLEELLRTTGRMLPGEASGEGEHPLVVNHSLQPFSPSGFRSPETSLRDPESRDLLDRLVASRLDPHSGLLPFADSTGPQDPSSSSTATKEVSLRELRDFFRNPAKRYLKSFAVAVPAPPEDEASEDEDPLDLESGLADWDLREEIFRARLDGSKGPLLARLQADRMVPYGTWGEVRVRDLHERLSSRAEELLAQAGGSIRRVSFRAEGNGWVLTGDLDVSADGSLLVLTTGSDIEKKAAPRVDLHLQVLLAAAAHRGELRGALVLSTHPKSDDGIRLLPLPERSAARLALDERMAFHLGCEGRLPAWAPETSLQIANAENDEEAEEQGRAAWEGDDRRPGESARPEYALAWRDLDPFDGGRLKQWQDLAARLLKPAIDWFDQDSPPLPDASTEAKGRKTEKEEVEPEKKKTPARGRKKP